MDEKLLTNIPLDGKLQDLLDNQKERVLKDSTEFTALLTKLVADSIKLASKHPRSFMQWKGYLQRLAAKEFNLLNNDQLV